MQAANDNFRGPKLINFPELKAVKGISYTRQHIGRLEKAGKFPRRVPVGDHRVAWVEAEIDAHILRQMASRCELPGELGSSRQAA